MRRAKPIALVADPDRHIFAKRPRCKACGSAALRPTKSLPRDGDVITRYVRCRGCGARFILMLA
jgi:hypothetical protein